VHVALLSSLSALCACCTLCVARRVAAKGDGGLHLASLHLLFIACCMLSAACCAPHAYARSVLCVVACMHAARRGPHTAHRAVLPAQAGHLPAGRHRRARPAARRSPCPFVPGGVGWVGRSPHVCGTSEPTAVACGVLVRHRCGMTACVRCLEKHRTCSGYGYSRSGVWCVVFRVRRRCCISTLLRLCPIGFCGTRHRVCPCGLPACTTRCMSPQCRAVLLARTLRSRRGSTDGAVA
jgi:hypothetical protein